MICTLALVEGMFRILSMNVAHDLIYQMETMGLTCGTKVKVTSTGRNGCVLELRGSRIAMGTELAEAILVEPCGETSGTMIPLSA